MKVSTLLTLALASQQSVFGLNIGNWFKETLGFLPSELNKCKPDVKSEAKKYISLWDGSKDSKNKEFHIKKHKVHHKNKQNFNPFFLKGTHNSNLAGVYIQVKCNAKEVVKNDAVKKAMQKSLEDTKIYTVRCGGATSQEKM